MATASAVFSPTTIISAVVTHGGKAQKKTNKVVYLNGLNSYGGLKAHNQVIALGQPLCTEQCFAKLTSATHGKRRGSGGGGALSATCNAAGEIFKIAAIMNALTLVGVAVGFVLLRIEASLEESE